MRAAAITVVVDEELSRQRDEIIEEIEESLAAHRAALSFSAYSFRPCQSSRDRDTIPIPPMRIFLTGATGYVGSAALGAFVRHGHDVAALVRHPGQGRASRERRRDRRSWATSASPTRTWRSRGPATCWCTRRSIDPRADRRWTARPWRRCWTWRATGDGNGLPATHHLHVEHVGARRTSRAAPPRMRRCGRRRTSRGGLHTGTGPAQRGPRRRRAGRRSCAPASSTAAPRAWSGTC